MTWRYHPRMRLVLCLLPFLLCVPLAAQDARLTATPAPPPPVPAPIPDVHLDAPSAAARPPAAQPLAAPSLPLTDGAIKRAVRDVLAEDKASAKPAPSGAVLGAERSSELRRFDVLMDDAFRPDCWHKDGLKRQPTGWGPIQFSGYAALPFIAVAALRGVCRL